MKKILLLSLLLIIGCDSSEKPDWWEKRIPKSATNIVVVDYDEAEFDFRGKHYYIVWNGDAGFVCIETTKMVEKPIE